MGVVSCGDALFTGLFLCHGSVGNAFLPDILSTVEVELDINSIDHLAILLFVQQMEPTFVYLK